MFGKSIDSRDISVVVKGAVDKSVTPFCLSSIRKFLPGAEIILSTWKGTDVSGLDYDKVVLNKDPGSFMYVRSTGGTTENNMNRQTVSVQNGLLCASRKYCLKLRSDLELTNNTVLDYFNRFEKREKIYTFFEKKVIVPSVFTKLYSHQNSFPVLYHVSDWWFFGLTEDLKTYFLGIKLAEDKNFYECEYTYPSKNPYPVCKCKMFPEQYYFISAFSTKFDIKFSDWTCWNLRERIQSEKLILNNFIVLDFAQHGIRCLKHKNLVEMHDDVEKGMQGLLRYKIYKKLYKHSNFYIFKEIARDLLKIKRRKKV